MTEPEKPPAKPPYPWLGIVTFIAVLLLLAGAWKWAPLGDWVRPERLSDWLEPHRARWYAGPVTVATFVLSGFVLVPMLALAFACGLAFGPWLGSVYAVAGSLSSAAVSFGVGRRLGRDRLKRLLGPRLERIHTTVVRRGFFAVFLVRKVPAPYTLVNLAAGSSGIGFRDFMLGTLFGTAPGVVLLCVFADQLARATRGGGGP